MFYFLILVYLSCVCYMCYLMHINLSFRQWSHYLDFYFKDFKKYSSVEELHTAEKAYEMLIVSWGFGRKR